MLMRNGWRRRFPKGVRKKVLILVRGVNFLVCRKFLILLWAQKSSAFQAVRKRSDGDEKKRSDLFGAFVFVRAADHGDSSKVRRRYSSDPDIFQLQYGDSKLFLRRLN